MSPERSRARGASDRGRPQLTLVRVAVLVVALMMTTSTVAAAATVAAPANDPAPSTIDTAPSAIGDASTTQPAGSSDAAAAAASTSQQSTSKAVDVVFVFDRSQSMNVERYQLANEMRTLQESLSARGVDARFGLVTYTTSTNVRQPLTDDFDEVERAMHFSPGGNTERASDAILTATNMDYRSDAEKVIVLVTDEDDDSDATTRQQALASLSGFTFLTISPGNAGSSACAVHSPPCDSDSANELRSLASQAGGDWLDIESDAKQSMQRVADNVYGAMGQDSPDLGSGSAGSGDSGQWNIAPRLEVTDRSANRTEVEVGDPVAFNVTVENTGPTDGTFNAYLSTNGSVLAERALPVPLLSERSTTIVHAFDEPGVYTVVLSHGRVANVEVREPDPTSVEISASDARDRLTAKVADAYAGRQVIVDLPTSTLLAGTGNQLRAVTVETRQNAASPVHDLAFDVTLERIAGSPEGTPAIETDARAVRYLEVTSSLPTSALRSVAFEYVKSSDDVTMYRYDETVGEWKALSQVPVDGAPGHVVASTSRLSTFALVVKDPPLSVEGVTVGSTNVTAGDLVTATATVRNNGTAPQSYDATITLDGQVVATKFVEVPAGESMDVPLSYVAEEPGTYAISVAGVEQGNLEVDPAPTSTDAPTTTESTTDEATTDATDATDATDEPSDETPGFSLPIAIVALLAAALLVARRRV